MQWTVIDLADAMRLARNLSGSWSSVSELVRIVAEQRSRPIDVAAADLTGTGITGTVLVGIDRDTIVHATDLPPFFAEHVILHELAHLLCGHVDGVAPGAQSRASAHVAHSDPAQELEAELLATAFAQVRSERARRSGGVADDGGFLATLAPHLLTR